MLTVGKVNNNNLTYRSHTPYEYKLNSFGNSVAAQQAYLDMNKDIYVDYVDGDISLIGFLARKLKSFWNIMLHKDPTIEIKARIIEENLRSNAQKELGFETVA